MECFKVLFSLFHGLSDVVENLDIVTVEEESNPNELLISLIFLILPCILLDCLPDGHIQ